MGKFYKHFSNAGHSTTAVTEVIQNPTPSNWSAYIAATKILTPEGSPATETYGDIYNTPSAMKESTYTIMRGRAP